MKLWNGNPSFGDSNFIINANNIYDNTGNAVTIATAACDNNLIIGNILESNGGTVVDSGTGTLIRSNIGVADN